MPKGIDGVADGLDALDELLELRDVEPEAGHGSVRLEAAKAVSTR